MTRPTRHGIPRREFAAVPVLLAGAAVSGLAPPGPLTAGQVIDRIKEHLGVPRRLCADWLRSFVSEIPVEWIPAGDPFWRP